LKIKFGRVKKTRPELKIIIAGIACPGNPLAARFPALNKMDNRQKHINHTGIMPVAGLKA
jgi:hypothetical protein